MPLDATLRQRLDQALASVDDHGTRGTRLLDDAARVWRRAQMLLSLGLVGPGVDTDALELSCYALQLPLRRLRTAAPASASRRQQPRTNLRDRAELAADMLFEVAGPDADEVLLDRATRVLVEMPHRSPMLDEAKILADALNLEDFGTIGLLHQVTQLVRQGDGIVQLAEGCEKREQYGYWEARLKDGFHFEAARDIARRRLDNYRLFCSVLMEELAADTPPEDAP